MQLITYFQEQIIHLREITAPEHPADHQFKDRPLRRGKCAVCGWIDRKRYKSGEEVYRLAALDVEEAERNVADLAGMSDDEYMRQVVEEGGMTIVITIIIDDEAPAANPDKAD
jgi:hypothetical protein